MFGGETQLPAAEDQRAGRHPADLRLVAAAAARPRRSASSASASCPPGCSGCRTRRPAAATASRCTWSLYGAADHLLLLLLHLGRVQSGRHGREPAQVRRLPAGHPAGQEHGGVPRLCADPPDGDRRGLHRRGLPAARGADRPATRSALLLRRHLDPDRGLGDDGHGGADPVAPAGAPVRRADQEVASCAAAKR